MSSTDNDENENDDTATHFALMELALRTEDLWNRLLGYARHRCHMLAEVGIWLSRHYAETLVADAVSDTATFRLRWNPDKCSLHTHLHAAIRSRTYKLLLRTRDFPHLSLSDPHDGELNWVELAASAERQAPLADRQLDIKRKADEVTRLLEDAAADDPDVLDILDALRSGAIKPSEIAADLDMSRADYRRAQKRLQWKVKKLPPRLRDLTP